MVAESKDQAREQNLRWAIEHYLEEQSHFHRVRLITALNDMLEAVQAEYDHALEQQKYYQAQTKQEAEAQKTKTQSHSYYHQFHSWAVSGMKDFFGSTPEQQAQKYAEVVKNRQATLVQLSHTLQALEIEGDQEIVVAVTEEECPAVPIASNSICDLPSNQLELSDLTPPMGFTINGAHTSSQSEYAVSSAGDVNTDGIDDLIIGVRYASPGPGKNRAGVSYVIFGSSLLTHLSKLKLVELTSPEGLVINGAKAGDFSGTSVSSAGDINADGIDDLVIGAIRSTFDKSQAGVSYVIFGSANLSSRGILELAD